MNTLEEGCLLRIFIGETDKHNGKPLYEWLVQQAKAANLRGATILRGVEGYGSHRDIHTAKILQLATNLPLVVEIIDTAEKINAFIAVIDPIMMGGLITLEKIKLKSYHGKT